MRSRLMRRGGVGIILGLLCAACEEKPAPSESFALLSFSLENATDVELNHALEWEFSAEVSPFSIPSELNAAELPYASIQIQDLQTGEPAQGKFYVEGSLVRFEPRLPSSSDLGDGGFKPETTYEVRVQGFPKLNGVRSHRGKGLGQRFRFTFSTCGLDSSHGFVESSNQPLRLIHENGELSPDASLVLKFNKALDPRTLIPESFRVFQFHPDQPQPTQRTVLDLDLQNHRQGAWVMLYLDSSLLPGDRFTIEVLPDVHDLGGYSCDVMNSESRYFVLEE